MLTNHIDQFFSFDEWVNTSVSEDITVMCNRVLWGTAVTISSYWKTHHHLSSMCLSISVPVCWYSLKETQNPGVTREVVHPHIYLIMPVSTLLPQNLQLSCQVHKELKLWEVPFWFWKNEMGSSVLRIGHRLQVVRSADVIGTEYYRTRELCIGLLGYTDGIKYDYEVKLEHLH